MTDIIGGGIGTKFFDEAAGGVNSVTGHGGAGTSGDGHGGGSGGGGGAGALSGGNGGAGYNGIGTGGTGGVHGNVGASLPVNTATGTAGGDGGDDLTYYLIGGGGGGGGGYGAVVTVSGSLGTLTADVTGGDGGDGGDSPNWGAGSGGRGGIGLYLDSSSAKTLTISSSVTGGNGGTGGTGSGSILNGNNGWGGEGIYGQNLSILLDGGSISGGLSGDGVTRADAIYFETGTNLLDIQGGTITGNVVANGSNDTFRLSGSTGGTFDVSQLGTKFQGFEHLGSAGTATWILTGNNATSQSWSASSGMIVVNGAMANTDFNIGIGATLGGSGTVGDVLAFGTVGLGDGVGILHTGDFQLWKAHHRGWRSNGRKRL